jgi:glycine/D-amino acid oxidase-like deaminating enzyme
MAKLGDHAVVLGASMAGLLAARTLSDFFQTVTVVERDVLPDDATNRRGVQWRAAWAKHHRRRYAHRSDDPIGMVEISVI